MKTLKSYNICFLGKTGLGKTSLINELFDTHLSTEPILPCTHELYSIYNKNIKKKGYECANAIDTPGIGEYSNDTIYQRYYEHAVNVANCIVLVVSFDRTDAPEQELLIKLKPFINTKRNVKFIVALNKIDLNGVAMDKLYKPWDNDKNTPSKECRLLIKERISIIHNKFDSLFLPFEVVPVCANRKYNIETLKQTILK